MAKTYSIAGLLSLVLLVGFLLRQISFFPYPEMLTETYFLFRGMLPYTQINDQHFPGLFLLPINLWTLGFDDVGDLRLLQWLIFMIVSVFLFRLTNKLTWIVVYTVFFFLWEGNTLWIDSFVTPLILWAFWRLYTRKSLILTGLILGIALIFKQHAIVICMAAGLWAWKLKSNWREFGLFVIMGAVPMLIAMLHFYQIGVFRDFWFWTITHNLSGYTSLEGKIPTIMEIVKLLLVLIPATMGWIHTSRRKIWVGLFVAGSLIYLFPRFGLIHAQPALPLLIFLWSQWRVPWIVVGIGLVLMARIFAKEIPGKVWFYSDAPVVKVDPNRPLYAYGVSDNVYHLTDTLPPQRTWIELLKGNIIAGVEAQIILTLKTDPPQFILVDPDARIDGEFIKQFTPKIWNYIQDNYTRKQTITNGVELWYAR